jgi:hypothetical protein
MEIVTKYQECQFFQNQTMKHANPLRPIDLSWPFTLWGIDIIGVLPRTPGGFRFLFVGIDTFTKWMEATPLVNIMQEAAVKFLQSIIYRFDIPQRVLTDNGTQFKRSQVLKMLCKLWNPSSSVISGTYADKWTSQAHQWLTSARYEDKDVPEFIGKWQELAQRVALSLIGPSNQCQQGH